MLPVTCHLHCLANHPCLTPCKIGTSLFPSISWTVSIWNKAPTYFPFKLCNLHCVTMIHNTFYGSPASFQCPEHPPSPPSHPQTLSQHFLLCHPLCFPRKTKPPICHVMSSCWLGKTSSTSERSTSWGSQMAFFPFSVGMFAQGDKASSLGVGGDSQGVCALFHGL